MIDIVKSNFKSWWIKTINDLTKYLKTFDLDKVQLYLFGLYFLSVCIFEDTGSVIKYTGIILLAFILIESKYLLNKKKIIYNIPIIFLCLFAFFSFISSFWAIDMKVALHTSKSIFLLIIFLIVSYNYFRRVNNGLDKLLKTISIVGILFSIYILIYYNPINYFSKLFSGERIGTEIANTNSIGVVLIVAFVITIFYGIIHKNKKYYMWSVLPLIGSIGAGSRKSFAFVLIFLIIMLIYGNFHVDKKTKKKILIALGTVTIILVILYFIGVPFVKVYTDRLIAMFGNSDSMDHSTMLRKEYINIGLEQFKKTPIFGIGIDNARLINSVRTTYLHNNYVELLASVGIIGFSLYYISYIIIAKYFLDNKKKISMYHLVGLTLLIGILVIDYGAVTYYFKRTYIYFLVLFLIFNNIDKTLSIKYIASLWFKLKDKITNLIHKMDDNSKTKKNVGKKYAK